MTKDSENQRLRPHPDIRFAEPPAPVDLHALARSLRAEPNSGERGHRQETIFKHGNVTIALFVFDQFSHLPEHTAQGVVTMQVLKGWMKISAGTAEHELRAGQMLVLDSGVRHALKAEEESEVLVSVHLGS
ncbi:MAG: cupin domain-containing protein [Phycisphaerae bacterium]